MPHTNDDKQANRSLVLRAAVSEAERPFDFGLVLRTLLASMRETSERRAVLAAIALLTFAWFATLGTFPLLDPDEGRYALIPHEMLATGDWVTPHLNGLIYLEKPPLQYWATAVAFALFGEVEWSVRLWTALTGLVGVLLTGWLGTRLYTRRVGFFAAAIQAGSLLYTVLGHLTTLDMGLCFALQLALSGMLLLVHDGTESLHRRAALLLAVGAALAFLSKGLVGVLIPAVVGCAYLVIRRDGWFARRSRPGWVLLILVLLATPWVVAAARNNPGFLQFFFLHEHFARFLSRVHDRYEPIWFFVPILLVGFMPWTPFLPSIVKDTWRAAWSGDRVNTLLAIWCVFILVFFSVSQSKLVPYILPLFPALAMLAGRRLATLDARSVAHNLWIAGAFWIGVGIIATVFYFASHRLEISAGAASIGLLVAVYGAGGLAAAAAWLTTRKNSSVGVCVAALGSLFLSAVGLHSAQALPRHHQENAVVEVLTPRMSSATSFYCVDQFIHSVPYYVGKPCTLVRYRGELDFGLRAQPDRYVPTLDEFRARWLAESDAVALVRPESYCELEKGKTPMHVLYAGSRYVVVARN